MFNRLFSIGIIAGIIFAAARAVGTIGPQAYRFILPSGFVFMALMPFIFLKKESRRRVGLTKSKSGKYYLIGIMAGTALALLCYSLGLLLFDHSNDNWFVSIKNSYLRTTDTTGMSLQLQFIVFTIPALIFSPIGEEIFFRGFLQEALTTKFRYRSAMILDSLFFALIHLFHHGIVRDIAGEIHFYPLSGLIWVMLMFVTAMAFAFLKKSSGSIYPAIVSHAVFNLVMNITIFYGRI
jgi:membrane protease YdiL (CAAX protease family)